MAVATPCIRGTNPARGVGEPLLKKLQNADAPALLNDLRTLAKRLRQKKRRAVEAELTYLESHQERMDYATARLCRRTAGQRRDGIDVPAISMRFKRPGQFGAVRETKP